LKAAEERCTVGGDTYAGAGNQMGMGNNGGQISNKRRESKLAKKLLDKGESLGLEWASAQDVPPVHMNRLRDLMGVFWKYMRPYIYYRGAYTFPWDVNWNRQCPELKARFIFRLWKLYLGPWRRRAR
jgi:hypothetical protein